MKQKRDIFLTTLCALLLITFFGFSQVIGAGTQEIIKRAAKVPDYVRPMASNSAQCADGMFFEQLFACLAQVRSTLQTMNEKFSTFDINLANHGNTMCLALGNEDHKLDEITKALSIQTGKFIGQSSLTNTSLSRLENKVDQFAKEIGASSRQIKEHIDGLGTYLKRNELADRNIQRVLEAIEEYDKAMSDRVASLFSSLFTRNENGLFAAFDKRIDLVTDEIAAERTFLKNHLEELEKAVVRLVSDLSGVESEIGEKLMAFEFASNMHNRAMTERLQVLEQQSQDIAQRLNTSIEKIVTDFRIRADQLLKSSATAVENTHKINAELADKIKKLQDLGEKGDAETCKRLKAVESSFESVSQRLGEAIEANRALLKSSCISARNQGIQVSEKITIFQECLCDIQKMIIETCKQVAETQEGISQVSDNIICTDAKLEKELEILIEKVSEAMRYNSIICDRINKSTEENTGNSKQTIEYLIGIDGMLDDLLGFIQSLMIEARENTTNIEQIIGKFAERMGNQLNANSEHIAYLVDGITNVGNKVVDSYTEFAYDLKEDARDNTASLASKIDKRSQDIKDKVEVQNEKIAQLNDITYNLSNKISAVCADLGDNLKEETKQQFVVHNERMDSICENIIDLNKQVVKTCEYISAVGNDTREWSEYFSGHVVESVNATIKYYEYLREVVLQLVNSEEDRGEKILRYLQVGEILLSDITSDIRNLTIKNDQNMTLQEEREKEVLNYLQAAEIVLGHLAHEITKLSSDIEQKIDGVTNLFDDVIKLNEDILRIEYNANEQHAFIKNELAQHENIGYERGEKTFKYLAAIELLLGDVVTDLSDLAVQHEQRFDTLENGIQVQAFNFSEQIQEYLNAKMDTMYEKLETLFNAAHNAAGLQDGLNNVEDIVKSLASDMADFAVHTSQDIETVEKQIVSLASDFSQFAHEQRTTNEDMRHLCESVQSLDQEFKHVMRAGTSSDALEGITNRLERLETNVAEMAKSIFARMDSFEFYLKQAMNG